MLMWLWMHMLLLAAMWCSLANARWMMDMVKTGLVQRSSVLLLDCRGVGNVGRAFIGAFVSMCFIASHTEQLEWLLVENCRIVAHNRTH